MQPRPLRPYFFKPITVLGVPIFYWKITGAAVGLTAVVILLIKPKVYGIPLWFVGSMAVGIALTMFFIWIHNTRKRGWLEYAVRYWLREIIGLGQNLMPEETGRKKTYWILDADGKNKKFPT